MSDLSGGARANLILNPGDVYRVSGSATVQGIYGAPATTTTLTNESRDFGPYDAPAKLVVTNTSGVTSYVLIQSANVTRNPATGELDEEGAEAVRNAVGGALPRYTGQFSSGARLPTLLIAAGTATQAMSRARYIARSTVKNPQFAFPNWAVVSNNSGLETGTGGDATITAALEYNGVSYPLKWSGSSSVVVTNLTTSPLSDKLGGVTIPEGAAYFIRSYYTNASGVMVETGNTNAEAGDLPNGEGWRSATTGLADQTTFVGAITGGTASDQNRYGPILHVAPITKRSFLIVGTSLQVGLRETSRGGLGFGDKGIIARIIGPYFGYANIAQGGASASNFLVSGRSTLRQALKDYFTDFITDHGINDILNDNIDAPAISAVLTSVAALFPALRGWVTTCLPRSSTAWTLADGSDQTAYTANSWATRRPALNVLIRAGIAGYDGYLDLSPEAELPTDSTKWYADGTVSYMGQPYSPFDGLHVGRTGAERIRAGVGDPRTALN